MSTEEQAEETGDFALRRSALPAKYDGRAAFSVLEAGVEILGLSRTVAYAAAKSGRLPTIKVHGRRIVPRAGLEKLLGGG